MGTGVLPPRDADCGRAVPMAQPSLLSEDVSRVRCAPGRLIWGIPLAGRLSVTVCRTDIVHPHALNDLLVPQNSADAQYEFRLELGRINQACARVAWWCRTMSCHVWILCILSLFCRLATLHETRPTCSLEHPGSPTCTRPLPLRSKAFSLRPSQLLLGT